jgi:phospholipase C
MSQRRTAIAALLTMGLTSCSAAGSPPVVPQISPSQRELMQDARQVDFAAGSLPTPIRHVIIIIQENRTPDYLFQGIPGADIATSAIDSRGKRIPLAEIPLNAPYDLSHSHKAFVTDYNSGKMDGFDAGLTRRKRLRPFGYAPESEVAPYHQMALEYALGDHMFEGNEGPSFPAHLYLVSGTATEPSIASYRVSDNPYDSTTGHKRPGGCDAPADTLVPTIAIANGEAGPTLFPCLNRPVLSDFLDQKGVTWRYYQDGTGAGLWHAFDAISHVRYGKDYANVIPRSQQILQDISDNRLAGVSWVTPADAWSDHASKHGTAKGPSWVAAIVNAVGKSRYWNTTAILVTWDDWGGWYDHVPPPIYNFYELGFRVPLLVISPYTHKGYVSKVQHEFGSILAFTEETYGIPKGALDATDVRADDLHDAFDFSMKARAFRTIKAPPFHDDGGGDVSLDEDP